MVLSNDYSVKINDDSRITWPYAETLICCFCSKKYKSRGKRDPGYCRDCGLIYSGGPLDGKLVGEILYDDTTS